MTPATITAVRDALKAVWLHENGDLYPTPGTAADKVRRRPERRASDGAWMGWDDPADYEAVAS